MIPIAGPQGTAFLRIGEPKDLAVLFGKMAKVLAEVGRVEKSGRNKDQGYSYPAEADFLDEIRPLLGKHGIAFFPTVVDSQQRVGRTSKNGGQEFITHVVIQTAFCCTDTGAMLVSTWHGEAGDWGDKSYWKAYTGTLKYAHSKTWMMSSGDDPEADGGVPAGQTSEPRQQRNQREQRQRPQPQRQPEPTQQVDEQTEFHRNLIKALESRAKALPKEFAFSVGDWSTDDLRKWVGSQWERVTQDVGAARRVARVLDAADKELTKQKRAKKQDPPAQEEAPDPAPGAPDEDKISALRGRYFAMLNERYPTLDANDRRTFQLAVTRKESSAEWVEADYRAAIKAVEDGTADKYVMPF